MNEDTEYCLNCKRDVSKNNFTTHSAHCQRNIEVCKVCKEPVPIKEMNKHVAEMHKSISCEKCDKKFEKWELEDHESSCVKRPVTCHYCEINCSWDEIKDHESYCGSRTEQCSVCQQYVTIKDKVQHDKEKCSNSKTNRKPVYCVDCRLFIPGDFAVHEKLCSAGKNNLSRMSSSVKCSNPCQYCGLNFPLDEIREHEYYCGARTELCFKCQKLVLIKNIAQHKEKCAEFKIKGKDGVYCFNCKSFISDNFELHKRLCLSPKDESFKDLKSKNMDRKSSDDDISQVTSSFSKLSTSEDMQFRRNLNSAATNKTDKMNGPHMKSLSPKKNETLFPKKSHNGKSNNEGCSKIYEKRFQDELKPEYNSNDCEPHSNNILTCATCFQIVKTFEYNSHIERCGRKPVKCQICNVTMLATDLRKHTESCSKKKFLAGQDGSMDDDSIILKGGMLRCPACKEKLTTFEMKDHKVVCRPKMEKCLICHEEVPMLQRTAHQEICLMKKNISCITTQKAKEDSTIPAGTTSKVIHDTMDDIPVQSNFTSCPTKLPKKFLVESIDEGSTSAHSELPTVTKGKQNHQILSKEHSSEREEKPVSVRRKTQMFNSSVPAIQKDNTCPHCKDLFSSLEIDDHMAHCFVFREECILCKRKIPISRLKRHQEECFKSVKLSVQQEYSQAECKNFVKECFVYCPTCKKNFSIFEIDDHMPQCSSNLRICQICKMKIPDSDYEAHQIICLEKQYNQQEANKNKTYLHNSENPFPSGHKCDTLVFREPFNDHVLQCTEELICSMCGIKVSTLIYGKHIETCARNIKEDAAKNQDRSYDATPMINKQKRKYDCKSSVNSNKTLQDFPPLKPALKTDYRVEEVSLPCEFCEKLFPEHLIIQHQSGCQPYLLHYCIPPADDEEEYFSASESFEYSKKMKSEKKKGGRDKNIQPGEFLLTQQQPSQSQTLAASEKTSANADVRNQQHGYPFADVVSHNTLDASTQDSKNNRPNGTLMQALESRRENMKSPETEVKSSRNESLTLGSETTFAFRKSLDLNKTDSLPIKDFIAKRLDKFDNRIQANSGNNDLSTYLKKNTQLEKITEKMAIDHVFNPGVHPKSQKKKKSKSKRKGKR